LKLLSLSFSVFSPSAFSILSLSFSVSLLSPSHFFLSLSLSLLLCLHHGFSIFLSFFSNIFFCSSSSFDRAIFKSQKIDYGDALYFFLSFLLFIFFSSSCFFCLQASTEDYKHMHVRFAVHLMFLCLNPIWRCFIFFFELSSVHLLLFIMFLLFIGLNWRVQTHASEIFLSSYVCFVEIFFFLLSQANKYGSLCFLLRSKWFLAWSYVSGV